MVRLKMATISYKEYDTLKRAIQGLGWTWQEYQRKVPDGWYEFKYQNILRHFMATDAEETLLGQAQPKRFPKCVKLPRPVYREMKDLEIIYNDLQDVLDTPPFGSISLSEFDK